MKAQLFSTRTVRPGDAPGNAYTSVMSAAGLSSTSGVSWWSEPRASLMTPAVPRPATARTANASRASLMSCMVSSVVGLPAYGGEPRADWVDGCLDPLPGTYEERLLRGLRRAARGLFRHRAQVGLQAGGRPERDDRPAAGGGVERAEAHGALPLLDGPELVGPARRSGREVERRQHDETARAVPIEPHRGRLAGGGEICGAHRGIEYRPDEPVGAVEPRTQRHERAAQLVPCCALSPVAVARGDRDGHGGSREPGPRGATPGERPYAARLAQHALPYPR